EDPNRLYLNEPSSDGPGFRFEDVGRREGVADPNAGMGVAAADENGDGRPDLFVTNSRGQAHAVFESTGAREYTNARSRLLPALGNTFTGWGASWVDLDLDGDLDLALANGPVPVRNLKRDAEPLQVLENLGGGRFA